MKKIIILSIGIIVILSSCSPCKRLQRKCPVVVKDSISYTEIVKFDTVILVSPADTLILRIPVEPDINDLIIDVRDKPGPSVEIKISDGFLEVVAICPEDSLKAIISSLETALNNRTTVTVDRDVPVKYVPKFWKYVGLYALCLTIVICLFVYLRIKKIV